MASKKADAPSVNETEIQDQMTEVTATNEVTALATEEDNLLPFDLLDDNAEGADLFNLTQQTQNRSNPMFRFRMLKASSEYPFKWTPENTKKADGPAIPELPEGAMAVRGVIISAEHGLSLYSSSESKTLCHTIAIDPPQMGRRIDGENPLPRPIYSPLAYQKENEIDQALLPWNPIGARGKSCAECVAAGEHINTYVDAKGETKKDSCGGSCQITMVVYEIGTPVLNRKERRYEVKWQKAEEVIDRDTNTPIFSGPFVLVISVSPSVATLSLKNFSSSLKTDSPVPGDVTPWGVFLTSLYDNKMVRPAKGDRTIFMTPVEMWAVEPVDCKSPMIKTYPVFRICTDPFLNDVGAVDVKAQQKMVGDAHILFNKAWTDFGGKLNNFGAPIKPVRALAPTKSAAAPAPVALKDGTIPVKAIPAGGSNPFAMKSAAPPAEPATVEVEATGAESEGLDAMPNVFQRS